MHLHSCSEIEYNLTGANLNKDHDNDYKAMNFNYLLHIYRYKKRI